MLRKTAGWILMLMIVLAAAVSASAADSGMILLVGDASAAVTSGAEIRVPVTATANPGYVSATFTLRWDAEALELCAVEFTDLAPDQGTPPPENTGAFTLRVGRSARRENYKGTGLLFTAVFRAAAAAVPGDYSVELTNSVVLNTDLSYVTVNAAPGTVRLLADTAPAASDAPTVPPTDAPHTQTPAVPAVTEAVTDAPTESVSAGPTAVPTLTPAGTAAPVAPAEMNRTEPPAVTLTEQSDEASRSTVPWLTAAVLAVAVAAAAVVFVKRRKASKDHQ